MLNRLWHVSLEVNRFQLNELRTCSPNLDAAVTSRLGIINGKGERRADTDEAAAQTKQREREDDDEDNGSTND